MLESLDSLVILAEFLQSGTKTQSGLAGGGVNRICLGIAVSGCRIIFVRTLLGEIAFPDKDVRLQLCSLQGYFLVAIFLGDLRYLFGLCESVIEFVLFDQIFCDFKGDARNGGLAVRHQLVGLLADLRSHSESLLEAVQGLVPVLQSDRCGSIVVEFSSLGHVLCGSDSGGHDHGSEYENNLFHLLMYLSSTLS